MGLTVSPVAPAEIKIAGTEIAIPSIYARIYMACNPDGITMSIGYHTFVSKAMYQADQPISTDVPNQTFNVTLDPATQEQSITEALIFAKEGFELLSDGIYTAVIDPSA